MWHTEQCVGKYTFSAFMGELSESGNLSKIYTNHSIRATGTTILARNKFSDAQIMNVTGHKSCTSLVPYHRVYVEGKIAMGQLNHTTVLSLPASENLPSICLKDSDIVESISPGGIIPEDLRDVNTDGLLVDFDLVALLYCQEDWM